MGGNAFDGLRRLNAVDYQAYEKQVLKQLQGLYAQFVPLRYYRQKPDFGDMDVVVAAQPPARGVFEAFLSSIGADDVFYNGSIYSFRYADFQVDLIHVETELFETAQFYFAYNDLNNLIGRVAHALGLKFGWDGLSYQIGTASGHRAKKVVLSRDPEAIYAFLGYDYARWEQGFDTLEDIFGFVASSPYFHPDLYALHHLNQVNRTRNRKRKTYMQFLAWCQAQEQHRHRPLAGMPIPAEDSLFLVKVHHAFPGADLLGKLKAYAEENAAHQERKAKFNGHLVSDWVGVKGVELGSWLARYARSFVSKHEQHAFFDAHSPPEIEAHFKAFYAQERASD